MTTLFTPMPLFNKPGPFRSLLEERGIGWEWVTGPDGDKDSRAALLARAPEMEFLLLGTTPLDGAFFAAAKKLKLVSMFGVGISHISIPDATAAGVLVTNVPGGNTRCVSELAFSFMLSLAHKVVQMHTDLTKGLWRGRRGAEISGKTLGIIGFGNIGQDMAALGRAFGMRVIFANRSPRPQEAQKFGAEQLPFEQVLAEADYLSLHIPGGPASWHFGPAEFALMREGAYFINTARGDLVDLDALTEALRSNHLAGAGLDVFPHEPMETSHPIFTLPQVVTTPHAGGLSNEAMLRVATSCLDEVARVMRNERSPNARNPEVYTAWGI